MFQPAHTHNKNNKHNNKINETNTQTHTHTEFERLGISDQPMHEGSAHSAFPANTNILYVGLAAARAAVSAAIAAGGGEVLPGLIFNLKKQVCLCFCVCVQCVCVCVCTVCKSFSF